MPLGIGGISFMSSACCARLTSPSHSPLKLSPTIPRSFVVSGIVTPSFLAYLHNEIAVKTLPIKPCDRPGRLEHLHPRKHCGRIRIPLARDLIGALGIQAIKRHASTTDSPHVRKDALHHLR